MAREAKHSAPTGPQTVCIGMYAKEEGWLLPWHIRTTFRNRFACRMDRELAMRSRFEFVACWEAPVLSRPGSGVQDYWAQVVSCIDAGDGGGPDTRFGICG